MRMLNRLLTMSPDDAISVSESISGQERVPEDDRKLWQGLKKEKKLASSNTGGGGMGAYLRQVTPPSPN